MSTDPFAAAGTATADPAPAADPTASPFDAPPAGVDLPETTEAPKETTITTSATRPVAADSEGKVVLTFKGGVGFDAPWIVVHAASLEEANHIVNHDAKLLADTMERVQKAGAHFAGLAPVKASPNSSGGAPQGGGTPPAAQSAPGGDQKFCKHGAMQFRSGVNQNSGKAWKAFFCPTPKGTPDQCKAEFIR
ncbi:hypothetical protein [Prescottella equi]